MYLSDLLRGLGRRWYFVVLGLLATAALSVGAMRLVPVDYVAQSSVLLLPSSSTVGTGGNPYLALGGLQGAADVLARAMTDDTISTHIAPQGSKVKYTVTRDTTTNGPMLIIMATDVTSDGALSTLNATLAQAPNVLRQLQSSVGAPSNTLIGLGTITQDTIAQPEIKSQLRAVILAGVVGLALTVFGTNLLDALVIRRKREPRTSEAVSTARSDAEPSAEPMAPVVTTPTRWHTIAAGPQDA
ncbi:MAG: hypothetical protein HHJ10_12840, partial [Cellulomonas sp.]|uniref:hypothetical protein n=1 Tax=Cellulomonas sp. TaxID=40001 RepID=UPI0018118C6A